MLHPVSYCYCLPLTQHPPTPAPLPLRAPPPLISTDLHCADTQLATSTYTTFSVAAVSCLLLSTVSTASTGSCCHCALRCLLVHASSKHLNDSHTFSCAFCDTQVRTSLGVVGLGQCQLPTRAWKPPGVAVLKFTSFAETLEGVPATCSSLHTDRCISLDCKDCYLTCSWS